MLTDRALEICNLPPGSRVADIGCGLGGTLEHLKHIGYHNAVGLDYSETLLGEAFSRLVSAPLIRGRAENLPFRKGLFDALFCECVLSVLGDGMAALRECARVLKEGGFLVVSDLFRRNVPGQGEEEAESQGFPAKGLPTKKDLIGVLTGLGFLHLLWEEHERYLKEFVARMLLAGQRLPDLWGCRPKISYFLLIARKPMGAIDPAKNHGDGSPWMT